MRLVRRAGKLDLFALRVRISPVGPVTSYATVNSARPDLRDLALLPYGTALISGTMLPAVPAVLQVPRVAQWRLAGRKLSTLVAEPRGRKYRIKMLSATGALKMSDASSSRHRRFRTQRAGRPGDLINRAGPPAAQTPNHLGRLNARVRYRDGRVVEELGYTLGRSLLSDGDFASGPWGAVGNCAAFPGTEPTAQLSSRVLAGHGPAGRPAIELSAKADSACEARSLAWRSGPLFLSLWVRNLSGTAPRICLWQLPIRTCAATSSLPPSSQPSRWYHYQTIVTPDPGARGLRLFLYADAYTPGALTTNEYSDVVVRRSPIPIQPVVVATPRSHERPAPALYTQGENFSPDWIGPSRDQHVEVDGMRNGWLGPHSRNDPLQFGPSLWYLLSRFASLLAACLLLALALGGWRGSRDRLVAKVRAPSGGRKHG
jgi:hypothetical protein